ncbi:hypothetical protein ABQF35_28280 [Mycobacterium syngnathidarum]
MGLLDTPTPEDNANNGNLYVDDARVVFLDGTEAVFDRVEFVGDGRLKATVVTSIDVGGGLVVPVANSVHYASGSWKSVHEPIRGCLIALTLSAQHPLGKENIRVVEDNILEKDVVPHGLAWIEKRMQGTDGAGALPKLPSATADSSELLGTRFHLSRPVRGWPDQREDYETILFRWVSTNAPQDALNSLIV